MTNFKVGDKVRPYETKEHSTIPFVDSVYFKRGFVSISIVDKTSELPNLAVKQVYYNLYTYLGTLVLIDLNLELLEDRSNGHFNALLKAVGVSRPNVTVKEYNLKLVKEQYDIPIVHIMDIRSGQKIFSFINNTLVDFSKNLSIINALKPPNNIFNSTVQETAIRSALRGIVVGFCLQFQGSRESFKFFSEDFKEIQDLRDREHRLYNSKYNIVAKIYNDQDNIYFHMPLECLALESEPYPD